MKYDFESAKSNQITVYCNRIFYRKSITYYNFKKERNTLLMTVWCKKVVVTLCYLISFIFFISTSSSDDMVFILKNIHFFHAQIEFDVCPYMKSLQAHISLNTAHSGCKPSSFMSSFTHSQVFLPLHFFPTTYTFPQANPKYLKTAIVPLGASYFIWLKIQTNLNHQSLFKLQFQFQRYE